MIQGGVLETEPGPAINTSASTIPEGVALDLALVLLVLETASVAGYPSLGAGETDVVDAPM